MNEETPRQKLTRDAWNAVARKKPLGKKLGQKSLRETSLAIKRHAREQLRKAGIHAE